jgi:hypothetical protein
MVVRGNHSLVVMIKCKLAFDPGARGEAHRLNFVTMLVTPQDGFRQAIYVASGNDESFFSVG